MDRPAHPFLFLLPTLGLAPRSWFLLALCGRARLHSSHVRLLGGEIGVHRRVTQQPRLRKYPLVHRDALSWWWWSPASGEAPHNHATNCPAVKDTPLPARMFHNVPARMNSKLKSKNYGTNQSVTVCEPLRPCFLSFLTPFCACAFPRIIEFMNGRVYRGVEIKRGTPFKLRPLYRVVRN